MKKTEKIREAIFQAIKHEPGSNPTQAIQDQFQISREAVRLHLKQLVEGGELWAKGYGKGRVYFLRGDTEARESLREKISTAELRKKGEDEIYSQVIAPFLKGKLNPGLSGRVRHISTEILNNVIDHSQSKQTEISISLYKDSLQLQIADDGIGVFHSIKNHFHLANHYEAVGELAKGKRTRDPANHAGEGLFFSSRMADFFILKANGIAYEFDAKKDDWTAKEVKNAVGSELSFTFDPADERATKDVFEKYTEDFAFALKSPRLVSPYTIEMPKGEFPSRSEAKKILAGADEFKSIVVDFRNVEAIGQGFADEMFRVFPERNKGVQIEVIHANDFVQRMIEHVRRR